MLSGEVVITLIFKMFFIVLRCFYLTVWRIWKIINFLWTHQLCLS